MIVQLAAVLNVDMEEMMEKLMQNDHASKQLFAILKVVVEFDDNDQNDDKTAVWLAVA